MNINIRDHEITTKTFPAGQAMSGAKAVIAVYNVHSEAEMAVNALQRAGFDVKKLSVVGKGYHTDEQVAACATRPMTAIGF